MNYMVIEMNHQKTHGPMDLPEAKALRDKLQAADTRENVVILPAGNLPTEKRDKETPYTAVPHNPMISQED